MMPSRERIKAELETRGHTSSIGAISARGLGAEAGLGDDSISTVSIVLSDMHRDGSHGVHREKRDGLWHYWLGRKTGKKVTPTKKKASKKAGQNGVGLYFTQENGEDILLTFEQAKHLYRQMKVIFD